MQLWSVNRTCAPCICGFAFGGGAPCVMRSKMAALCQEKVRQRLVTLGKIRQKKSENMLPASAWFCLHEQQSSGFPDVLLSHVRDEDLLPVTTFSLNSVPPCPLWGPKHKKLIFYFRRSFLFRSNNQKLCGQCIYKDTVYIFELVPQSTNRGLCRTINQQ